MSENLQDDRSQPLLIVISGPSGVGKDSVIQGMKERDQPFHFVVTVTTRPPRPGERQGEDYFFISEAEFFRRVEGGELIEHATVYEGYKGVPRQQVRQALASGLDVVLRLDVQGAAAIRELCPDALLIFLVTPDETELVERLKARNTESREVLARRAILAQQELDRVDEFDYVVVNARDQLDQAVDTILAIICAEHHRVHPRKVSLE
jgi:guanylate kinase